MEVIVAGTDVNVNFKFTIHTAPCVKEPIVAGTDVNINFEINNTHCTMCERANCHRN